MTEEDRIIYDLLSGNAITFSNLSKDEGFGIFGGAMVPIVETFLHTDLVIPVHLEHLNNLHEHWKKDNVYGPTIWYLKQTKKRMPALYEAHERYIQQKGIWDLKAIYKSWE